MIRSRRGEDDDRGAARPVIARVRAAAVAAGASRRWQTARGRVRRAPPVKRWRVGEGPTAAPRTADSAGARDRQERSGDRVRLSRAFLVARCGARSAISPRRPRERRDVKERGQEPTPRGLRRRASPPEGGDRDATWRRTASWARRIEALGLTPNVNGQGTTVTRPGARRGGQAAQRLAGRRQGDEGQEALLQIR